MDLTPSEIRRQQFEQVRRGFDPQEVGVFLERVASMIADRDKEIARSMKEITQLQRSLDEARSAEEAVRLTMLAATKAKDEILAEAETEAQTATRRASDEASAITDAARREALELLESTRRDSEALLRSARDEEKQLNTRIEALRDIVLKTEGLLKGMASGALEELAHAGALLRGEAPVVADATPDDGAFEVVVETSDSGTNGVDPVDQLLEQLRGMS